MVLPGGEAYVYSKFRGWTVCSRLPRPDFDRGPQEPGHALVCPSTSKRESDKTNLYRLNQLIIHCEGKTVNPVAYHAGSRMRAGDLGAWFQDQDVV
jgi:hypothetical protein